MAEILISLWRHQMEPSTFSWDVGMMKKFWRWVLLQHQTKCSIFRHWVNEYSIFSIAKNCWLTFVRTTVTAWLSVFAISTCTTRRKDRSDSADGLKFSSTLVTPTTRRAITTTIVNIATIWEGRVPGVAELLPRVTTTSLSDFTICKKYNYLIKNNNFKAGAP